MVLTGKGEHPPPRTEEIATVITAMLTAIGGPVISGAGVRAPAWLSKLVIRGHNRGEFQGTPTGQAALDG